MKKKPIDVTIVLILVGAYFVGKHLYLGEITTMTIFLAFGVGVLLGLIQPK